MWVKVHLRAVAGGVWANCVAAYREMGLVLKLPALLGYSSLAVDGNTVNAYLAGSCTHTDVEYDPWWQVDLLDSLEIEAREQAKLEQRQARALWLLLPDSKFLQGWLCIIGPLIVYNVIWVPLEVSQMVRPNEVHGQIDFILDFFFYVDMILTFRTAYIDKDNELVLDGTGKATLKSL